MTEDICENCNSTGKVEVDYGGGDVRTEVCDICACSECFKSPCQCSTLSEPSQD